MKDENLNFHPVLCSSSSQGQQNPVTADKPVRLRRRPREELSLSISSSTSAPLTAENDSQDLRERVQERDPEEVRIAKSSSKMSFLKICNI